MIIDTTVSVIEEKMKRNRYMDFYTDRQLKKLHKKKAVYDFLLTKGQNPGEHFNYVAFWKDGKVIDAHFVCEDVKKEIPEEKLEVEFQKLLDKFDNFMKFAKFASSTRKNQELSK